MVSIDMRGINELIAFLNDESIIIKGKMITYLKEAVGIYLDSNKQGSKYVVHSQKYEDTINNYLINDNNEIRHYFIYEFYKDHLIEIFKEFFELDNLMVSVLKSSLRDKYFVTWLYVEKEFKLLENNVISFYTNSEKAIADLFTNIIPDGYYYRFYVLY